MGAQAKFRKDWIVSVVWDRRPNPSGEGSAVSSNNNWVKVRKAISVSLTGAWNLVFNAHLVRQVGPGMSPEQRHEFEEVNTRYDNFDGRIL